jgi:hypothetical protein
LDVVPPTKQQPSYMNSFGWVLTRLHARYTPKAVGEDLVFRKAQPITGGREFEYHNSNSEIAQGSSSSTYNNFQARYAIRHPWQGAILCPNPQRGIWGGPPPGTSKQPIPALESATKLALLPPTKADMSTFVVKPIAALQIAAKGSPVASVGGTFSSGNRTWLFIYTLGMAVIGGIAYFVIRKRKNSAKPTV